MTPWRRFFDRLLLAGAIFMAVMVLIVLVSTIRSVRETSQSFRGNLSFYAMQVQYEAIQLLDHLDRFSSTPDEVTLEDVQIRFDILWSRVFIEKDQDILQEGPAVTEITAETIDAARAVMIRTEPFIEDLVADDEKMIQHLKHEFRSLIPVANQLVLAAKDNRAVNDTAYLTQQLRQARLTFGLIIGMTLFGILSTLLLRADRHVIARMNVQLEERVRKRTEDLQSANARLAAEIVERKRNQTLASEREARLAQAVQLAKLGFYVWDTAADRCEFCSDQHAASHGLTPEEYLARASDIEGPFNLTHPDDREKVRLKYRELRQGNIIEMAYRVNTPSGTRRLREIARPIFDDSGNVVREIGTTLDVTEQYETEMKLFEAQRMDSIGKMTGGVAHDFNNLLAVILGNLELMSEIPDGPERDEMIEDAIRATLRGRDLTMNMLSFARRAPHDPSELNLNEVIGEMQGMLRRTLPENIEVDISLAGDVWTVMADRSLTESALLNLAINARDAMPDGGKLTIETANVDLGAHQVEGWGEEIEPGSYVMMAVIDTGKGIAEEVLDNIFEPFFTTKAITKNSGLGLSMVHGFIRQSGGAIRVYSEPGEGTTFQLYFSSAHPPGDTAQPAPPPVQPARNRDIRVLLVEDDDTVRRVLTRQMEQCGMTVVAAADSASAEKAFRTGGPYDLVVSDIVMPGDLQGPALVRHLRSIEPNLPAVFLSDYPQVANVHGNGVVSDDAMLMKPVGRDDLMAAIEGALSTTKPSG